MTAPAPAVLAGLRLPGGTSRVDAAENALLCDAVRAPRSPHPHPIWAFLAPQRGMGVSLAALFEALGCPLDTGPLLGRFAARWSAPFALDADHRVDGGVAGVRRRRGRTLGVVDEVDVVLDVRRDDVPVLTATYGFLLPRPDVTDADLPGTGGDTPPPVTGTAAAPLTVRAAEMALLARLLRDPNPVHLDADAAVGQGHRARVNQGPANLAYVLTALTARHPDRPPAAVEARFRATVVDGDVVTPVIGDVTDDGSVAVALRHADGRDAVTGRAGLGP